MKKRYILLFIVSFFLISLCPTVANAAEETDVTYRFKDENLKQAIIQIIQEVTGQENKTNITIEDINTITAENLPSAKQLNLAGKEITDLTGLELFAGKNIEWIYLDWNQIQDISVLSRFTTLTKLSLSENAITDITPLKQLTNLTNLTISNNQITTLDALASLSKLQYIYADNNQITSVEPLTQLTRVTRSFFSRKSNN